LSAEKPLKTLLNSLSVNLSFTRHLHGFEAFVVVFLVLAAVALWSTVKMVPQGYNYTVENFGRYTHCRNFAGIP
jgi:hypothetical protein